MKCSLCSSMVADLLIQDKKVAVIRQSIEKQGMKLNIRCTICDKNGYLFD